MGKILQFDRRSYIYATPSEEESILLITDYLRNCPRKTSGLHELRENCRILHQQVHHKPLSDGRFRWGLGLLLGIKKPPVLQLFEIKRKRYVRLLPKK